MIVLGRENGGLERRGERQDSSSDLGHTNGTAAAMVMGTQWEPGLRNTEVTVGANAEARGAAVMC